MNWRILLTSALLASTFFLPVVVSQEEIAIFDLVSKANDPFTVWRTGTFPPGTDFAEIPFGTDPNPNGMARYHRNVRLNDGRNYPWVLETHPKWVANGAIEGRYREPVYVPETGARLRVLVGFLEGASAGRARVQINLIVPGSSPTQMINLLNQEIVYADGVKEFTVEFPANTRGNTYEMVVIALAGESSTQDWIAWARIWVTARVGLVTTTTRTTTTVSPTTITQTTTVAMGTTVTTTRVETSPITVRETTTRVETSPTTIRETITQTVERPTTIATTRFETTTQKETVLTTVTQIQPTVILQTVTVQGGGGLASRCLIATAAFGSELDPSVQTLRQFRDGFVLQTFAGRTFMDVFNAFYYSWSPSVAAAEYSNHGFRTLVKYSIYPLIGVLQVSKATATPLTIINPELSVLAAGITASFLLGLTYLSLPTLLLRRFIRFTAGVGIRHVVSFLAFSLGLFVVALAALDPYMMAFASSAIVLTTMFIGAVTPAMLLKRIARG